MRARPPVGVLAWALAAGGAVAGLSAQGPLPYQVTRVTLSAAPLTRDDGSPWDTLSAPDVYVAVYDGAGRLAARTSTQHDVRLHDFPLVWTLDQPWVLDAGERWEFRIFDDDVAEDEVLDTAEAGRPPKGSSPWMVTTARNAWLRVTGTR